MGVAGISYASACGHNCGECQEIQMSLKPLSLIRCTGNTTENPHRNPCRAIYQVFYETIVYENFFEALARLKGLWSIHGLP